LQPFTALYVLILAILGPIVTKETKHIYNLLNKLFKFDETSKRKKEDKQPVYLNGGE